MFCFRIVDDFKPIVFTVDPYQNISSKRAQDYKYINLIMPIVIKTSSYYLDNLLTAHGTIG